MNLRVGPRVQINPVRKINCLLLRYARNILGELSYPNLDVRAKRELLRIENKNLIQLMLCRNIGVNWYQRLLVNYCMQTTL